MIKVASIWDLIQPIAGVNRQPTTYWQSQLRSDFSSLIKHFFRIIVFRNLILDVNSCLLRIQIF